jgi:thiamine biosynthesis lipoprotein
MGTVFSIDVRAPGVDRHAIADVVRWLHWVDATFSTYQDGSQISRLGRGAIGLSECAEEVTEVLERCTALRAETEGFFDARAGGRLDPSGYVKGWAIERASDLLVRAGSTNHCVNGGGDVQCVGTPTDDREWQVGIAHPLRSGELIASVPGRTFAVATSGTAERGRHIIDPHTRKFADALASVTVIGRRLADVDAYATAAFAMGTEAEPWLAAHGIRALIVHCDGRTTTTAESLPGQG